MFRSANGEEGNHSHRQNSDYSKISKNKDDSTMTIEKSGSSLSLHKIDCKLSTDALLEKKYCKYFPRDFFTNQDQLSNLNSSNENNFSEPKIQSNGEGQINVTPNIFSSRHNSNCFSRTPVKKLELKMAKIAKRKYPLPPMSRKPHNSFEVIQQIDESSSIYDMNKVCLPILKSPEISSQKQEFVLSLSGSKVGSNRASSLLRNSSNNPFQSLTPLEVNLRIPKIVNGSCEPKSSHLKTEAVKRFNDFGYIQNKENLPKNIEDPTPKFMDGFYETFSKNGNIKAPDSFGSPKSFKNHRDLHAEIEINRLDSEYESDDFSRSTPDDSNYYSKNSKNYENRVKVNYNEKSPKLQFGANNFSDNEAMRKTAQKTKKIFKKDNIKYMPARKNSRVTFDKRESSSNKDYNLANDLKKLKALQPIFVSSKSEEETRNQNKFDGSKRIVLVHQTEFDNSSSHRGKVMNFEFINPDL